MKKLIVFLTFIFISSASVFAQGSLKVEMADQMRADGKIYVVVAVVLIVFIGMIFYLINLDRKISKIEQETKEI